MRRFARIVLCVATALGLHATASAALVTKSLSWTGAGGYSASGSFSYDDTTVGGDNQINQGDLTAFSISFFDPSSTLLKTYSALAYAQLFTYHTDTGLIDQGPSINLVLGEVNPTGYLLARANGCTGDNMILYQGTGPCTAPNLFLDRAGTLVAADVNAVPEPGSLALLGLGLAGLAAVRRRKAA